MRRPTFILLCLVAVAAFAVAARRPALAIGLAALVLLLFLAMLAVLLIVLLRGRAGRRERERRGRGDPRLRVPPKYWKKPDPCIYDQFYLMSQGMDVTWDNPDIWLEEGGVPITGNPVAGRQYDIAVRVWNNSLEAPAFHVAVRFFVRDYGAGATPEFIGATDIPVLQVRALPPAETRLAWRAPPSGGHYCLLVQLVHGDDANPANNEGQENLNVVAAAPGAPVTLVLPIHNPHADALEFTVAASAYRVPGMLQKGAGLTDPEHGGGGGGGPLTDVGFRPIERRRAAEARAANALGAFALPPDWGAVLPQGTVQVPAGGRLDVAVPVTLPADLAPGRYPVNLQALTPAGSLYGGVTVLLDVKG
jgi:hypothetical protein